MSLKIGIETAVHITNLQLKELNQIGYMQYRISLFFQIKNSQEKIFFMPSNIDSGLLQFPHQKSEPTMDVYCSYSRKFQVNYLNQPIKDGTTFYFKGYLDRLLVQKVDLFIVIDLLFAEHLKAKFLKVHTFQAKIKKVGNLFEYLPICFDNYGTLSLTGIYHSALMEYKFQKNQEESEFLQRQYSSFNAYLQHITSQYCYEEIVSFYNFYRQSLEGQLMSLQQKLDELSKIILNQTKKSPYSKLNKNKKLFKLIQKLYHNNELALSLDEKQQLGQIILEDILNIKSVIYLNWTQFNELIKANSEKISNMLKGQYQNKVRQRLQNNIFSHKIKKHDWTYNKYGSNSYAHLQQVQIIRKVHQNQEQMWKNLFPIENINFFQRNHEAVKIFEEIYETGKGSYLQTVPENYQHVIFLVHGFQAHRNDFIEFKLCLQANLKAKVYISCTNIGKTEGSIDEMGIRLSIEVNKYVSILKKPYKISFIGHSMGGIIIRSALEHLSQLQNNFHAYISLCTPHLGYLYHSSPLVQAGLWFLNNFQKCDSMLQLTMQDNQNMKDTFLYKLAAKKTLNKFKKIAFIGSSQDEYVSFGSARAEKNAIAFNKQLKDKEEKQILCDMVDNMLGSIEANQISRIDIIFNIDESNFDSFIGRTGHVRCLCDHNFLKLFVIGLDHLII